MPGEKDPANYTLPQQPIHRSLLARCARFSTFRPVTNPCDEDLDGIRYAVLQSAEIRCFRAFHAALLCFVLGLVWRRLLSSVCHGMSYRNLFCRLIGLSGQSVADVMRYTCASAVDVQAAAGEPLNYMEAVDAVAAGACPPGALCANLIVDVAVCVLYSFAVCSGAGGARRDRCVEVVVGVGPPCSNCT